MMKQRLRYIYMANLAKVSKKYKDMHDYVRKLTQIMRKEFRNTDLVMEEKLCFNTAYKKLLMEKRR